MTYSWSISHAKYGQQMENRRFLLDTSDPWATMLTYLTESRGLKITDVITMAPSVNSCVFLQRATSCAEFTTIKASTKLQRILSLQPQVNNKLYARPTVCLGFNIKTVLILHGIT